MVYLVHFRNLLHAQEGYYHELRQEAARHHWPSRQAFGAILGPRLGFLAKSHP